MKRTTPTSRRGLWLGLLLAGLLLEFFSILPWQGGWFNEPHRKPLFWVLANVLACVAAYALLAQRPPAELPRRPWAERRWAFVAGLLGIGLGLGLSLPLLADYFRTANEAGSSDIVPSLQYYVQRLLAGEPVYTPMPFDGWTVWPNYMPLRWLPFVLAEWGGFDYRWIPLGMFVLWLAYLAWQQSARPAPPWETGLKVGLPMLAFYFLVLHDRWAFISAVEFSIVTYYLILGDSLFRRSAPYAALGIVLCLLSRFSFTFWLPAYGLMLWQARGWRFAFGVAGLSALGLLLLYVWPFLSADWSGFGKGMAYYQTSALGEWYVQGWQAKDAVPYHLGRGYSFSLYFYDMAHLPLEARFALAKRVHLWACIAAALLLWAAFVRLSPKNPRAFALIALKAYLIVFYGLFYAPYHYIYHLPFMLGLLLLAWVPWAGTQEASRQGSGTFPSLKFTPRQ